jgi:hypothetical protein
MSKQASLLTVLFTLLIVWVTPLHAQTANQILYTSAQSDFSLRHPDSWVVVSDEQGMVVLADSPATQSLYTQNATLQSGQLVLQIFGPRQVTDTFGNSLADITDYVIDGAAQTFPNSIATDVVINDRPARRVGFEGASVAYYIFSTPEDMAAIAVLVSGGDGLSQAEMQALPVLETITTQTVSQLVIEPATEALDQQYALGSNNITFQYPAGWTVDDKLLSPAILVSNGDQARTFANEGVMSSILIVTRPSQIDPALADDAPLSEIAFTDVAGEFLKPRVAQISDFDGELVMVYDEVMTLRDVTVFMLRLDDQHILKWRVETAMGESASYYPTLVAMLDTVEFNLPRPGADVTLW